MAIALALSQSRMIFWFVLFAWSGIAAAFTPVVLCSLFWKRTTRAGRDRRNDRAASSITVVWVLCFKERFWNLYEMIPGFAAGFGCTFLVSLLTDAGCGGRGRAGGGAGRGRGGVLIHA